MVGLCQQGGMLSEGEIEEAIDHGTYDISGWAMAGELILDSHLEQDLCLLHRLLERILLKDRL